MSKAKTVGGFVMAPLIAAGTSVAASYVVKKGPQAMESVLPWLRDALENAGGVAEKVPDKAKAAASSGGDLAEQLTERVKDATGLGGGGSEENGSGENGSGRSSGGLSPDELTKRSEDRAARRDKRRKATKKKT